MKMMNDKQITKLIEVLIEELPGIGRTVGDKIEGVMTGNDYIVSYSKSDGKILVEVSKRAFNDEDEEEFEMEFNDSATKELVNEFKERVESIDGNTYLEILEEMQRKIDIKEFDDLLELEKYDAESAGKVSNLIIEAGDIIRNCLQKKIQNLIEVYDNFSR